MKSVEMLGMEKMTREDFRRTLVTMIGVARRNGSGQAPLVAWVQGRDEDEETLATILCGMLFGNDTVIGE